MPLFPEALEGSTVQNKQEIEKNSDKLRRIELTADKPRKKREKTQLNQNKPAELPYH